MPKIVSAQQAKNFFLLDEFPEFGYFVIYTKKGSQIRILELGEYLRRNNKKKDNKNQKLDGKVNCSLNTY